MKALNHHSIRVLFLASIALAVLAALLVFGGVIPAFFNKKFDAPAYGPAQFDYQIVQYSDLEGWREDDPQLAFEAFLRSCDQVMARQPSQAANAKEYLGEEWGNISLSGKVADWLLPCGEAGNLEREVYADDAAWQSAMRAFFEAYFAPVQIQTRQRPLPGGPNAEAPDKVDETGLFTGYFEPVYAASLAPTPDFSAPVYRRPNDLVEVDLGAFREELSGRRIAGRIDGGRLVPYQDHGQINAGAIAGDVQPIAWMDPNDLFFLQIQGSGRLELNGEEKELRIGYAGQNGHAYTAIGKVMVDREIMPLSEVSMQSIRAWLDASPEAEAREMREQNASYVFFTELEAPEPGLGPLGAQGLPLTPGRSLAVDLRYHMLGAPVWVDLEPVDASGPIRRLMVAQDTGGAIRGPVRGDFFWGSGAEAGEIAGKMKARGKMIVLTPRSVAERLP
ncbi:MAG: membrane-bound lytic murein transglycosylase A [Hyphococcus sp.]|nr:MAG: membrane-bound lytic murein transglycosylase A [Marinicaulis sp.]